MLLKEVNFESFDVPSGAIIHEDEGSPEAKTTLENSDLATFSQKFGLSTIEDWGYFGFSLYERLKILMVLLSMVKKKKRKNMKKSMKSMKKEFKLILNLKT